MGKKVIFDSTRNKSRRIEIGKTEVSATGVGEMGRSLLHHPTIFSFCLNSAPVFPPYWRLDTCMIVIGMQTLRQTGCQAVEVYVISTKVVCSVLFTCALNGFGYQLIM